MDAFELLRIAGHAPPPQPAARDAQALRLIRRYAVSCRRDRRRGPAAKSAPRQLSVDTQAKFFNRTRAQRKDDIITIGSELPIKVKGSGKWKQLTPHEILRLAFSSPASTMKSLAERCTSSVRHLIDLLFTVALLLRNKQADAIEASLAQGSGEKDFVILQLQWDETKFKAIPFAEHAGKGTDVSVMASAGRVAWYKDGCLHQEEVVLPCIALDSTSAASMWGGFSQILPTCFWQTLQGDTAAIPCKKLAVTPGADHASANRKLIAHLIEEAPETTFYLPGLCKQHASGLCLSPLIRHLNIGCPAFCISKLFKADKFYTNVQEGIKVALRAKLDWITEADNPHWQPSPEDVAHAESIMEIAYYHRDLRTVEDPLAADELRGQDKLRRSRGAALVASCPGNWMSSRVVHWCRGCCTSREEAIERVYKQLTDVGFHVLAVPSMNKWLSVWPLISDLVFMMCYHNIFIDAVRHALDIALDTSGVNGEELSELSEAELLGMPSGDTGSWHKQEHRRTLKVLRWLESGNTLQLLLLFLHTASPVMKLHYTLFKYAQHTPYGEDTKSYLFNLCDFRKSVAAKIVGELTEMLISSSPWKVLEKIIGVGVHQWPVGFKETARDGVLGLLSQIWRRLVHFYTEWPWLLVPLADPDTPRQRKLEIAQRLMACDDEALDPGFSRKVKSQADSAEALLEEGWQKFLYQSFNHVILSTAFIECIFAQYKQWFLRVPKPPSMGLMQGKHMSWGFRRACGVKRDRAGGVAAKSRPKVKTKTKRPEWVFRRGEMGARTARHIWMGKRIRARAPGVSQRAAFAEAVAEWSSVDAAGRASAAREAHVDNVATRQLKADAMHQFNAEPDFCPSFWDIGEGTPYPLSTEEIREVLDEKAGISTRAAEWAQHGRRARASAAFPAEVQYPVFLQEHLLGFDEEQRGKVNGLLDSLRVLYAPRGFNSAFNQVMQIVDDSTSSAVIIQCCARSKGHEFLAEFALYAGDDGNISHQSPLSTPTMLRLKIGALQPALDGTPSAPMMLTETQLAAHLVKGGQGPWRFLPAEVDHSHGKTLMEIYIERFGEPIQIEQRRAEAVERARAARALRLLKRAQRSWREARRRGGRGRGRSTGGGRGRGRGRGRADGRGRDNSAPEDVSDIPGAKLDRDAAAVLGPVDAFKLKNAVCDDENDIDEGSESEESGTEEAFQQFQVAETAAQQRSARRSGASAVAEAASASTGSPRPGLSSSSTSEAASHEAVAPAGSPSGPEAGSTTCPPSSSLPGPDVAGEQPSGREVVAAVPAIPGAAAAAASEGAVASVPPPPPPAPSGQARRPREGGANRHRIGAGVVVAGHLDEYRIEDFGIIKIDRKRGSLNAHCACKGQDGGPDHRTATMTECRKNTAATKTPIGFLVQWLRVSRCCNSRQEHVEMMTFVSHDKDARIKARQWVESQPHLAPLLQFEAESLGKAVGTVSEPEVGIDARYLNAARL